MLRWGLQKAAALPVCRPTSHRVLSLWRPSMRWLASSPKKRARKAAAAAGGSPPVGKAYGRFTVALVGRPNVGKSSLFNRLVGSRVAIVNKTPGTTRDWKEAPAYLAGLEFTAVDTGGLDEADRAKDSLDAQMLPYTADVLGSADVALFIVDAREGVNADDLYFARWIRQQRSGPVVVIANKSEGLFDTVDGQERWDAVASELAALGLGEPTPVSAEHGEGMGNLFEALEPFALAAGVDTTPLDGGAAAKDDVCMAIVGRPNVGKSTLLNRLVASKRVLTGPTPGVTRDAVKVQWSYGGRRVHLVDTAGIRRMGMWDPSNPLEGLSVSSATKALSMAHVVALVLDGLEPLTKQDLAIAQAVLDEGRALVVVLNKCDQLRDVERATAAMVRRLTKTVADAKDVPCIPLSALEGNGVEALMPTVLTSFDDWNFRITTGRLNKWLALLCRHHPPPAAYKNIRRHIPGVAKAVPVAIPLKLKFIMQIKSRPPTFVLSANRSSLPEAYHRFLVNALREEFGLHGVPVRLLVRSSKNPFKPSK